MHEYVATEPLPTQVHHRSIKKSASNGTMTWLWMQIHSHVEVTGDDGEYEIVEIPFRQPKTTDVIVKNPAYMWNNNLYILYS